MKTLTNNGAEITLGETTPTSGRGWKWNQGTSELVILLEVDRLAEDEEGRPCAAGVKMTIGPFVNPPTVAECEQFVAKYERDGIGLGGAAKALTWEQFNEDGYNEE